MQERYRWYVYKKQKNIFFKVVSASTSLHNGVFQARPFPICFSFTISARNFLKANVILGKYIPRCSWFEHAGKDFQLLGFNRSQKKGERKGEEKKIIELYHKENKRQNQPRTLGKLKKKTKKNECDICWWSRTRRIYLNREKNASLNHLGLSKREGEAKSPDKKATAPGVPKRSPIQVLTGRYRA